MLFPFLIWSSVFQGTFKSQFSQERLELESLTLVNICRMSACIIRLTLRVTSFILLFYPFFFFSLFFMLTLKICVRVFRSSFAVETWNFGMHIDDECGKLRQRIRLIAHILPFVYPFSYLFYINLRHIFLRN